MKLPYTRTSDAITGYTDSKIAKTENRDCVVRAVASASGLTYDKAHGWVADKFKRKNKKGTFGFPIGMNGMATTGEKLNRKSVKTLPKENLMNGKSQMSVGTFVKMYDKGTYIIRVTGHAFTIKDGVVIGNTEDAVRIRRVVKNAWRIGR